MRSFDEVDDALLTSDPGAQSALRRTREIARDVDGLKHEVAALRRTVATLAAILEEEGVGGGSEAVRRRIAKAMRGPQEHFDGDSESTEEPAQTPRGGGSPYRDALAPAALACCARCGKTLDAEDPELSLSGYTRVCVMCFQRGD